VELSSEDLVKIETVASKVFEIQGARYPEQLSENDGKINDFPVY